MHNVITTSERDRRQPGNADHYPDTLCTDALHRYTRLAAAHLGTPMAAITLLDSDDIWFTSAVGVPDSEGEIWQPFCEAVIRADRLLVVNDADLDSRLRFSPAVRARTGMRFFAGAPLRARDGHLVGALCVMDTRPRTLRPQSLDRLAKLADAAITTLDGFRTLRHLRALTLKDALTGLPNRAQFYQRLNHAIAYSVRRQLPLSLLYLDCDNFKHINTVLGRIAGDQMLQFVAANLAACLAPEQVAGRLGSDEFAVILPGIGPWGARQTAGRIRAYCNEAMANRGWPTTLSVGCVTVLLPPVSADAALALADDAMLGAKQNGKNQIRSVVVSQPTTFTHTQPVLDHACP